LKVLVLDFFRQLVHDRSPELAFYASRFLMEIIQTERPEQYTAVLSTLLMNQARRLNDEQLLKNPYLQILEILNLFGGSSDTNTATFYFKRFFYPIMRTVLIRNAIGIMIAIVEYSRLYFVDNKLVISHYSIFVYLQLISLI